MSDISRVTERLHRQISGNGYGVMELEFGDIQEWAEVGRPPGRPRKTLNTGNRADIVILNQQYHPIYVIEVNRSSETTPCLKDLRKIRDLILGFGRQRGGSLRGGYLAFMVLGWETEGVTAEQCLKRRVRGIKRGVRDEFQTKGLELRWRLGSLRKYPKKYRDRWNEPHWAHAAVCFELWSSQRRSQ